MKAACVFPSDTSKSLYKLSGYVLFNQKDKNSNVDVSILINNLPPGRYGLYINNAFDDKFNGEYMCIDGIKVKKNTLSIMFTDPLISLVRNDEGCIINKKLNIYEKNINNVIVESQIFFIY